ncbi:MAG TPA: hypothetical protein VFW07_29120 [Parafilimonas sp.]|nr:hypothetical protein [Parafilimonas sp.]
MNGNGGRIAAGYAIFSPIMLIFAAMAYGSAGYLVTTCIVK